MENFDNIFRIRNGVLVDLDFGNNEVIERRRRLLEDTTNHQLFNQNIKDDEIANIQIPRKNVNANHVIEGCSNALRFAATRQNLRRHFGRRSNAFLRQGRMIQSLKDNAFGIGRNRVPRIINEQERLFSFVNMSAMITQAPNFDVESTIYNNEEGFGNFRMNRSRKYPCFAAAVRVFENVRQGRGIKAIGVGEKILTARPFASAALTTDKTYCLSCHRVNTHELNFIPCERCTSVMFCSIECKVLNRSHEYECDTAFHRLEFSDVSIKCAIQMIFEMRAMFETFNDLQGFIIDDIQNGEKIPPENREGRSKLEFKLKLIRRLQKERYEGIEEHAIEAFAVIRYFTKLNEEIRVNANFIKHLILHNLGVLKVNSFGFNHFVRNSREPIIGIAIYDAPSFFNHSCSPNVLTETNGNLLLGYTCERIARNQELSISYHSGAFRRWNTRQRRAELRASHNFICNCKRCLLRQSTVGRAEIARTSNLGLCEVEHELSLNDWSLNVWSERIEALKIRYEALLIK